MLAAMRNYRPDNESTPTTLSSPPYAIMREVLSSGPSWREVRRPRPTFLSGQTNRQTVCCHRSFAQVPRRLAAAACTPHGYAGAGEVAIDAETPVLPDRRELQRRFRLTEREAEVALLLADRRTNKEIARTLNVTTHTAKRHGESVLGKLGINSRRHVLSVIASRTASSTQNNNE